MIFEEYCNKYGKNHDMMAPFVVEERRNGLMNPDGFFTQHRPEMITVDDYLSGRWIAKPANIYDNDLPIQAALAVIFTTPELAKHHKQKPVYILNHAQTRPELQGAIPTLAEWERASDKMGRMLYEGAGIGPEDLSFENMYDGFTLFHQFHVEGLRFASRRREAGIRAGPLPDGHQHRGTRTRSPRAAGTAAMDAHAGGTTGTASSRYRGDRLPR